MSTALNPEKPGFRHLHIFGAGGSGREVAWLAEQIWGSAVTLDFVVDHQRYLTDAVNGIPVHLLSDLATDSSTRFVVALGNPVERRRVATELALGGHKSATLIHPRAEISSWVEMGEGSIVCARSSITCNVRIGAHVHINIGCSVSHDVAIGDYSTISPGVNVAGNVHIGKGVFVGINACFINGHANQPLSIGDGAVIAAGACVTRPVPPGTMVAGVPATRKR